MAKLIDLNLTSYGYETAEDWSDPASIKFVTTRAVLQAILYDDSEGWKRVVGIVELEVGDNLDSVLNSVRRWAKKEGYVAPIPKSAIVLRQARRGD